MADMAGTLAGTSGLIDIGPWVEHDGERVVGISRSESREAFEAAMPGSGVPSETVHEWEAGHASISTSPTHHDPANPRFFMIRES
jgi:hypothetical protein